MFFAAAIILAAFLVWKQARSQGLSEEKIFDLFLLTLFGALVLARVGFVALHWPLFAADPARIFLVLRYPGMTFLAGLLAGVVLAGLTGGFFVLDLLTLAFSWAVVIGFLPQLQLSGYLLLGAILIWLVNRKIKARPGWLFSAYLIFFLPAFLIGETKWLWLLEAGAFVLFMIKFPADVLGQIKTYLEMKRQEAQHRLGDLKKEDPFEDKSRLLDRASEDTEAQSKAGHERVAALQRQLNTILIQTRQALTKIKIGKYGVCENCGKMIDTDRLAAMPTATLCLACEKKREK